MRPDPKTEVLILVALLGWIVIIHQSFTTQPPSTLRSPLMSDPASQAPAIAPGHWSNVLQHPVTLMTKEGEVVGEIAITGPYYLAVAVPPEFKADSTVEAGVSVETTTLFTHLVATPRPRTPGTPIPIRTLGQFRALFGQHGFQHDRPKILLSQTLLAFISTHLDDPVAAGIWKDADLYVAKGDVRNASKTSVGCTGLRLVVHPSFKTE